LSAIDAQLGSVHKSKARPMPTGRLALIHWNADEAHALARPLRERGWTVEIESEDGGLAVKRIKLSPPDAVLISLDRLPSHGRETAAHMAETPATRSIPLFFIGGQGGSLAKALERVPRAFLAPADGLAQAVESLIGSPPAP
jgi:hypothetical protein